MESVEVLSEQDLYQRPKEFFQGVENGQISLITKDGCPAMMAFPFNEKLMSLGVNQALGLYLFENGLLTMVQAAKLIGVSLEEFMEILGKTEIPAVSYSPDELEKELEVSW